MSKRTSTEREQLLKEIQDELTKEINDVKDVALKRASIILNREVSIQSLNGIVGGKNNTYVDSVRTQFLDFEDFFARWIKGLNDTFDHEKETYIKWNSGFDWNARASFKNVRLLQDDKIFLYSQKFLERNFYKHIDQRIRLKPDESLWSMWFGYKLTYGLLIAPTKSSTGWRNDKSEIRKVKYNYWTVGHVMQTGLIDPMMSDPIKFADLNSFYSFYQSVLKRLSNSNYEQEICDLYIDYLKSSVEPLNEPFLIPEFRYAGLTKNHEHRLDFTILNQHTVEFIGFEISPASSHMSVSNLKQKQVTVNDELKKNWEKEMSKRNKYFDTFGITTKTFTDTHLKDINACFDQIKQVLSSRPKSKISVSTQRQRLNSF
jgi:hypothetical protein